MLFLSLLWGCFNFGLEDSGPAEKGLKPIPEPDPIHWEACSYQLGDHICDFTYANAQNTTTTLYDNYGEIVVIDYFTEWCPYCRQAAEKVDHYIDEDTILFSVMVQNQWGNTPRVEDVERWASAYQLEPTSVLAAGDYIKDPNGEWGPDIQAYPSFIIIDKDMIIREKVLGWSLELMRDPIVDIKSAE